MYPGKVVLESLAAVGGKALPDVGRKLESVGDMPCAIRSGFTYSTAPAYSGRYLSANVDFPEPFGLATTWHIGLVSSLILLTLQQIRGGCGARGDIAVRTKLLRLLGKGFFRLFAEDGPELRDDALKLQLP